MIDPGDNQNSRLSGFIHTDEEAMSRTMSSVKRSASVKKLRLALPVIAGAIVVFMFVWSDMESVAPPPRKEKVAPQSIGRNELLNPRFESEDTNQQPYTITAKKAFQESADLNRVILDKPVADISLKDGAWLAIEAEKGEFEQVKQVLTLENNVKLFHDDGYEMTTNAVDMDIVNEKAISTSPVKGHGPMGQIKSQGLIADGKTGIITFQGPATLTINQKTEAK